MKPLQECTKQHKISSECRHFLHQVKEKCGGIVDMKHCMRKNIFNCTSSANTPMPKCATTRIVAVKLIQIKGILHTLINCDCCYCTRKFQKCRHFYCVEDNKPEISNFHPEYFKTQESNMFSKYACTSIANKAWGEIEEHKGHLNDNHIKTGELINHN